MEIDALYRRARNKRANPLLYGFVRVTFQAFFHLYFRFQRIGREHVPRRGPVIIASNHRSFLDPFVIACMARRPMYYVAKKEIFLYNRIVAWLLAGLGAFPVDRGAGDADFVATAKAILARGDIVLIFPEGTRTRPGPLGRPKRGVGRLALETGAPVVPIAVIGTEAVRRGWRIRPHKVRIRAGRPLQFPHVETPSPALAGAVTDRIWPCVMLQWEWLGGAPPARRVAIIGDGSRAAALAQRLAGAGLQVDANPESLDADIVCLATPAAELPSVLAARGGAIPASAGILVACDGVVPPLGTLPSAFVAERSHPRALAVLGGPALESGLQDGAAAVVASLDRGFARELANAFGASGLSVSVTADVTGVELAGCATEAAALAAAVTAPRAGAAAAGAAAATVFAEVDALARARGGRSETFTGMAGAGALVAAVIAAGDAVDPALETDAASIPLLLAAARSARVRTPALDNLAALVEGRIDADEWTTAVIDAAAARSERPVTGVPVTDGVDVTTPSERPVVSDGAAAGAERSGSTRAA